MKFKKKRFTAKDKGIQPLFFGVLLNALLFPLFSLLCGAVVYSMTDPAAFVGVGSLCAYLLCAGVCGTAISKKYSPNGLSVSVASAVIFTLMLLILGLILTRGALGSSAFLNHVCYVMTASLFAFIGRRRKRRTHRSR